MLSLKWAGMSANSTLLATLGSNLDILFRVTELNGGFNAHISYSKTPNDHISDMEEGYSVLKSSGAI